MFGHFLLEQGVDLELQASMGEVLDFIDREIPNFGCGGYGYNVSSGRGIAKSEWKLTVKPTVRESSTVIEPVVGFLEVQKRDEQVTSFKIPPRIQWGQEGEMPSEQDTKLFTSFIFQTLNAFQDQGYIQLPGALPLELGLRQA